MGPTTPTTAAEWKVIRWLFGPLFLVVCLYLLFAWWHRGRECADTCVAKGFSAGQLHFNAGGRFNLGTYCECIRPPRNS